MCYGNLSIDVDKIENRDVMKCTFSFLINLTDEKTQVFTLPFQKRYLFFTKFIFVIEYLCSSYHIQRYMVLKMLFY